MGYSANFDENYHSYENYLDTVMGTNDFTFAVEASHGDLLCGRCFTALYDDIFSPNGFYVDTYNIPIVFESRCTLSIIPYKEDFVEFSNVKRLLSVSPPKLRL